MKIQINQINKMPQHKVKPFELLEKLYNEALNTYTEEQYKLFPFSTEYRVMNRYYETVTVHGIDGTVRKIKNGWKLILFSPPFNNRTILEMKFDTVKNQLGEYKDIILKSIKIDLGFIKQHNLIGNIPTIIINIIEASGLTNGFIRLFTWYTIKYILYKIETLENGAYIIKFNNFPVVQEFENIIEDIKEYINKKTIPAFETLSGMASRDNKDDELLLKLLSIAENNKKIAKILERGHEKLYIITIPDTVETTHGWLLVVQYDDYTSGLKAFIVNEFGVTPAHKLVVEKILEEYS